jgi:catechol 2,3-dioxygenase-like lactoylglutathione lyase family enzyme
LKKTIAFCSTASPDEARRFYEGILGLRFEENGPFALVFDAGGTMLRIER